MNPLSTFLIPFSPSRADFPTSYHCTKKITLERPDSFPSTMEKDIKIRTVKVTGRKKSFILIFIDPPYPLIIPSAKRLAC
jgi:16S rRNA G966 N2-methylase RsmD